MYVQLKEVTDQLTVRVLDLNGNVRKVFELDGNSGRIYQQQLDLSGLGHGTYLVQVIDKQSTITRKIIVTR